MFLAEEKGKRTGIGTPFRSEWCCMELQGGKGSAASLELTVLPQGKQIVSTILSFTIRMAEISDVDLA